MRMELQRNYCSQIERQQNEIRRNIDAKTYAKKKPVIRDKEKERAANRMKFIRRKEKPNPQQQQEKLVTHMMSRDAFEYVSMLVFMFTTLGQKYPT